MILEGLRRVLGTICVLVVRESQMGVLSGLFSMDSSSLGDGMRDCFSDWGSVAFMCLRRAVDAFNTYVKCEYEFECAK